MSHNLNTPDDVLRAIKDEKIQKIDLRFTDLSGLWRHFSVPASEFDLDILERGVGLNGCSTGRLQEHQTSDKLALPDPGSVFLDPFARLPTLALICNVRDAATGQSDPRDPRHIAQKAEAYLQTMQLGDTANFGLELEHLLFDDVHNDQSASYEHRDAANRKCRTARGGRPERTAALRRKDNDFDVLQDIRMQVVTTLEQAGVRSAARHDEIATRDQGEIGMHFARLTRMADDVMVFRYVVDNIARQRGMTGTFVMNSLFCDNGSGMRVNQSIWQGERPLFAGDGYAGSSALMRHYFAGLREHAAALLEICTPTADPSPRPVLGAEASRNPCAAECHIPTHSASPRARHVGFRCGDPSGNPYLAFAAMLMAGIDGFDNRLYDCDPDEPIETRYHVPPLQPGKAQYSPDALEADRAFLLKGDVFTPDVIETHRNHQRLR